MTINSHSLPNLQNNLFRGTLGAILVSVIDLIAKALGTGWTFVLLGCICAALTPIVYVVIKIGPRWRRRRAEKELQAGRGEGNAN